MSPMEAMDYFASMERLDSPVFDEVMGERARVNFGELTAADVEVALASPRLSRRGFAALLSPAAAPYLEEMAQAAQRVTRARFGTDVTVFTPLYISNYCANVCTYCAFSCTNTISRVRLETDALHAELKAIADTGLEDILILTGESVKFAGVDYIAASVAVAAQYFRSVGIEVQPMNSDEYAQVHAAGADFVHIYQETYDVDAYAGVHTGGHKRSFPYRFDSQERALRGGMHTVGFAALLGLADPRLDAYATGIHADALQRRYAHAGISLSCPRIRPILNGTAVETQGVDERLLVQILCAYRLFLPFAGITLSTRESAEFRDAVVPIVATRVSAGVSTGVGKHTDCGPEGDEQFDIDDVRSVDEVCAALRAHGLQPVLNDHVRTPVS